MQLSDSTLGEPYCLRCLASASFVRLRTAELGVADHRLQILSTTDGLTALANRHRFDRYRMDEWLRALRQASPRKR